MARIFRASAPTFSALAALAGCVCALAPAAAQTLSTTSKLRAIDPRTASKLVVNLVKPDYPAVAKVNYIQGYVRLAVLVAPDGRVSEAHVVQGHPLLAASALSAVRQWVYRPLRSRSGPVPFQTSVDLRFALYGRWLQKFPPNPVEDFNRQVQPPEVLESPGGNTEGALVVLRVLVDDKGLALDARPLRGPSTHYDTAQRIVEYWKFRPARWGAVPVPWYLEVNVPVEGWEAARAEAGSRLRCP